MEEGPHPALGIDHGDARIGIAATDPLGILAHPVETIDVRAIDPIERIAQLVQQRGIRTLVVGLPVRIDGTEGTAAEKVRGFAAKVAKRLPDVPMEFVDEAYTTMAASAKLREAGRKAKQQKGVIDQAAAVEILDAWMNGLEVCAYVFLRSPSVALIHHARRHERHALLEKAWHILLTKRIGRLRQWSLEITPIAADLCRFASG